MAAECEAFETDLSAQAKQEATRGRLGGVEGGLGQGTRSRAVGAKDSPVEVVGGWGEVD